MDLSADSFLKEMGEALSEKLNIIVEDLTTEETPPTSLEQLALEEFTNGSPLEEVEVFLSLQGLFTVIQKTLEMVPCELEIKQEFFSSASDVLSVAASVFPMKLKLPKAE